MPPLRVPDFDSGNIAVCRECGLSLHNLATSIDHNLTLVQRISNRWDQEDHTERHAGFQRSTNASEARYVIWQTLENRTTTSWTLSLEVGSISTPQVSALVTAMTPGVTRTVYRTTIFGASLDTAA
ncbi:hypothetical protein TNCV_3662221 [Trichonephila clavipes]|nr:hypothetical protein TNCV_3662221 [Trichonephila clavipes]